MTTPQSSLTPALADLCRSTPGVDDACAFNDEGPINMLPNGTAVYEAFIVLQQQAEFIGQEFAAENCVSAEVRNPSEKILVRRLIVDGEPVYLGLKGNASTDLPNTLERAYRELTDDQASSRRPAAAEARLTSLIDDLAVDGSAVDRNAGYQQPPASYQQPPAAYQQPPAAFQQPPAVFQQPPAAFQQPPAAYDPAAPQPGPARPPSELDSEATEQASEKPKSYGYYRGVRYEID